MSAWEFSRCGFGCGGEDKDEHPPGCLPAACFLPGRPQNTCGKVTGRLDGRGRESGLSQHLGHLLPSPRCTQLSHKIIILIYGSRSLHLALILFHSIGKWRLLSRACLSKLTSSACGERWARSHRDYLCADCFYPNGHLEDNEGIYVRAHPWALALPAQLHVVVAQ